MLKKMFALTGALTAVAGAAYAGPSCCAPKAAAAKSTATTVKSCCADKAKHAGMSKHAAAHKGTAACCAKDAKATATATKKAGATKTRLTEVLVCPIMGGRVHGKGGGNQVVGTYNVHFCCAGCKPAFNKLSKAEQQKKIQAALKKQKALDKTA